MGRCTFACAVVSVRAVERRDIASAKTEVQHVRHGRRSRASDFDDLSVMVIGSGPSGYGEPLSLLS